jgi:hypothetical protein
VPCTHSARETLGVSDLTKYNVFVCLDVALHVPRFPLFASTSSMETSNVTLYIDGSQNHQPREGSPDCLGRSERADHAEPFSVPPMYIVQCVNATNVYSTFSPLPLLMYAVVDGRPGGSGTTDLQLLSMFYNRVLSDSLHPRRYRDGLRYLNLDKILPQGQRRCASKANICFL